MFLTTTRRIGCRLAFLYSSTYECAYFQSVYMWQYSYCLRSIDKDVEGNRRFHSQMRVYESFVLGGIFSSLHGRWNFLYTEVVRIYLHSSHQPARVPCTTCRQEVAWRVVPNSRHEKAIFAAYPMRVRARSLIRRNTNGRVYRQIRCLLAVCPEIFDNGTHGGEAERVCRD